MNTIQKEGLSNVPQSICEMNDWVEYEVCKGQDFNAERREYFEKGFDRALKVLHAWACGVYNDTEDSYNEIRAKIEGLEDPLMWEKGRMDAFRLMKQKIMSMYEEETK